MNYKIKLLNEFSINEQVEVYADSFDTNTSIQELLVFWKEKHYSNPVGNSYIFGAYDDDELVGINAFLQMKYINKNKKMKILQSCESGVKKSHRRKGIWKSIMQYAMNYFKNNEVCDYIIGFPNYKNSYPGFMKLGWEHVIDMSNILMVNNGIQTGQALLGRSNIIFKLLEIQKIRIITNRKRGYKLENFKYDNTKKQIWLDDDYFSVDIDEAWVEWRKKYKNYNYYQITKNDEVIGVVVDAVRKLNGVSYIEIVKLIQVGTDKEYINGLKFYFSELMKRRESNFIRVWYDKTDTEKTKLKKMWFIETKKHPNPFIVFQVNDQLRRESIEFKPMFWDLD